MAKPKKFLFKEVKTCPEVKTKTDIASDKIYVIHDSKKKNRF